MSIGAACIHLKKENILIRDEARINSREITSF